MTKRAIAGAMLIATLSLTSLAAGTAAQEPAEEADPAATSKSAVGVVSLGTSADGRTVYYLTPDGGDPIRLSFGPPWFWGEASPLDSMVGMTVTVIGQLRDGVPNENADEMALEQADAAPRMHVRSVDGTALREPGRPPWAGGPKEVGEIHPGFEGWSEGQAEREADQAARAAEKAANAEAKAAEKAADAAARTEERAARAEEKGNRP